MLRIVLRKVELNNASDTPVRAILVAVSVLCVTSGMLCASGQCELLVGAATVDITPEGPIALSGQMTTRIAREIRSPLMATAIALESLGEG